MSESLPNGNDSWRSARRQRREARRMARGSLAGGAWVGGAILISIGVFLLLENRGALSLGKYWSLLILLPAAGAFLAAWQNFQEAGGTITPRATAAVIVGLLLILLTASVFFELNWGFAGPLLIILAGLAFLVSAIRPGQ